VEAVQQDQEENSRIMVEIKGNGFNSRVTFSIEEIKDIIKRYETQSATEIAKAYKVNSPSIILILKKNNIKTRTKTESQRLYLQLHNDRSKKQSEFMKSNNPMDIEENRKKCSQPREKNAMWSGGRVVKCECGKSRYLKPSQQDKLVLGGKCWDCYHHSKNKSSIEILMAEELTKNNITFKEQVKFHGMFLDFLLPNKIVIECDGEYWHNLPENKKRDIKKNTLLKQEGYKLFRFSESDIKKDVASCVVEVT